MLARLFAAAAVLTTTLAPAYAVTVHNRDAEARQVTFDKGAEEVRHEIAAGGNVSEACPTGCGVRVEGRGHDVLAADNDVLSIRNLVVSRDTAGL